MSGPIPLLALAIVFSLALFFAYKEIGALRTRLTKLETNLPTTIQSALASLTVPLPVAAQSQPHAGDFGKFADVDVQQELRDFAREAEFAFAAEAEAEALAAAAAASMPAADGAAATTGAATLQEIEDEASVPTATAKKRPAAAKKQA